MIGHSSGWHVFTAGTLLVVGIPSCSSATNNETVLGGSQGGAVSVPDTVSVSGTGAGADEAQRATSSSGASAISAVPAMMVAEVKASDGVAESPEGSASATSSVTSPPAPEPMPAAMTELPPTSRLCQDCLDPSTCDAGGECVLLNDGDQAFCTVPCLSDDDCADGFLCFDIAGGQCVPETGLCPDAAVQPLPSGSVVPESMATPVDCEALDDWDSNWSELELEVLELVNLRRAEGATCGDQRMPPVGPLTMSSLLTCAARGHSQDMGERGFFDQLNPDGASPADRVMATNYQPRAVGENIASGSPTSEDVMAGWMNSPGHCTTIMRPEFTDLGVGYFFSASSTAAGRGRAFWTQTFGAAR